ncbi:MAG TPA: cell surface protein [Opitutaceae bacterium]|nr:cell surface protein [Opitutaceae bacterium]
MDPKRISFARQFLPGPCALLALAALCGCTTVTLTNLTPSSLPENPSGIYTFTLRVIPKSNAVSEASIAPHVVVGAESHDMARSAVSPQIYEFDYKLPAFQNDIGYYYVVDYSAQNSGSVSPMQAYTPLQHAAVVSRYVLSLEANRGPVGARVGVLGRGFTPQDLIGFDGAPVRTVYESSTSLGFYVPALEAGRTYKVTLSSSAGNSSVGAFRIDASDVTADPAALTLAPGGRQALTFTVGHPAPAGGLLLDVTTDVPESVIMPEVVVAEGQTAVTIEVEGGKPGSGSLFLKGYGSGEVTVPVTVSAPAQAPVQAPAGQR